MNKLQEKGLERVGLVILGLFALSCVIPFIVMLSASFTDEATILKTGYGLWPVVFSLTSYNYLLSSAGEILRAYAITFFITIVGTTVSLAINVLLAWPISRTTLRFRNFFNFYVVFTLLFNGGLVPTYLIYTQYLGIKNTIFALIVPNLLLNGFAVMLVRTYFTTSIPNELIESAKIDGAGEFLTFRKIVLPMSLPILATVGLLTALAFWNDWFNGLIYINKKELFSLQNVLNRILTDVQFLKSYNLGSISPGKPLPSETIRMALASIAVVPILCAYPFFQKYFVKGIALGALKG